MPAVDLRLPRSERLTVEELLRHFGYLRGGVAWPRVAELAERLDLGLDRPIHTLSKGNKQKVGIVQALMNDPQLLILDEPTSGLDPLVQLVVHELLFEVPAVDAWRALSPDYRAIGSDPLAQGLTVLHLFALIAAIALLTVVAVWRFDRRDIST